VPWIRLNGSEKIGSARVCGYGIYTFCHSCRIAATASVSGVMGHEQVATIRVAEDIFATLRCGFKFYAGPKETIAYHIYAGSIKSVQLSNQIVVWCFLLRVRRHRLIRVTVVVIACPGSDCVSRNQIGNWWFHVVERCICRRQPRHSRRVLCTTYSILQFKPAPIIMIMSHIHFFPIYTFVTSW